MPHVSKNKLTKSTEEELVNNLNLALTHIDNGTEMITFLGALLSPTEKVMLAKRLAIVILLEEGLSDSEISRILHVTRITVTKMKYFYESHGQGFKIALKRLDEQKKLDGFKKLLISLAKYSIRAAGGHVKPQILD